MLFIYILVVSQHSTLIAETAEYYLLQKHGPLGWGPISSAGEKFLRAQRALIICASETSDHFDRILTV